MAATLEDIKRWVQEAVDKGATHLIVACDTHSWSDYPHRVMPGENPRDFDPGEGGKIMECYALHLDLDMQFGEYRARHFEMPPKEES